jgi:hypothetical protein
MHAIFIDEYERNILIELLIENWTGKDCYEYNKLLYQANTGFNQNWFKKLLYLSRGHMFKISKQMTDDEVIKTLNRLREICFLAGAFGDILYDEQQNRKRHVISK